MNPQDDRETAALDALITASLHIRDEDVTAEEVHAFLAAETLLPPEKLAEFQKWLPDLLEGAHPKPCDSPASDLPIMAGELYSAMNRKNAEDVHSNETEDELERKRAEARQRLEEKNKRTDDT